MSRKAPARKARDLFGSKATAGRVTPCTACKGFSVPGRRVKSVARDARGRFK